jgi:hypothetical protein
MTAQHRFHVLAEASIHGFEMRDRLSSPDDCEMLAAMLYRVEEISEVPSCVRGRYVRHIIRLSDMVSCRRRIADACVLERCHLPVTRVLEAAATRHPPRRSRQ